MAAVVTESFEAKWPQKLDPAKKSFLSKITQIFLKILFFPLVWLWGHARNVACRCIVMGIPNIDTPIRNYWDVAKLMMRLVFNPENFKTDLTEEGKSLIQRYQGESPKLTTPDGAHLDGAFFPGRHRKKAVLFMGGNAEQWENSPWFNILKPLSASILVLNSRGVGNSNGQRYEDGYALDMYTACEYLIQKKGIDPEDIVFAGFSMGGANATRGARLIQEKYPDKKISAVNINSFSSLQRIIQDWKGFFAYFPKIGAKILQLDLEVKRDWDTLKGKKVIFHQPQDPVIPLPAQLATAVKKNPIGETHIVQFEKSPTHFPFDLEEELATFQETLLEILKIDRKNTSLPQYSFWNRVRGRIPTLLEKTIIAEVA